MKKNAFTLVELMVVVVIVAILAVVTVPIYQKYRCQSKWGDVQGCLASVELRLENYRSNHGVYPTDNIWTRLGFDGGVAPDCGNHYEVGVTTTATTYIVYLKDTKKPLPCTDTGFNDTWASVSTTSDIYHVYNSVDKTSESLPTGFTVP
jgi:prepilin-type N-terminal cleavage/methylation domain-containing protein